MQGLHVFCFCTNTCCVLLLLGLLSTAIPATEMPKVAVFTAAAMCNGPVSGVTNKSNLPINAAAGPRSKLPVKSIILLPSIIEQSELAEDWSTLDPVKTMFQLLL